MNALFIINSIMLGAGLAMDAFTVSLADGLAEPDMGKAKGAGIAGTFAFFQFIMPVAGWLCVRTVEVFFRGFTRLIPWIALLLLGYIGGKMLLEGIRERRERVKETQDKAREGKEYLPHAGSANPGGPSVGAGELITQGIATSIDALSVGFTFAEYTFIMTVNGSLIIAAVTFILCAAGVRLGRVFGMKLSGRAQILGGLILIGIGLEIFITGLVG